jgi:SAM-dependent methyltransferase
LNHNYVCVPIFELDEAGAVIPNPLFHRSYDKLHSRCIEYPFTASKLGQAERILDVGSVKADRVWINWLEQLPCEVHVTDYDDNQEAVFLKSQFHQADIRSLPLPDNYFDVVMAVSVIEHIGLASPQVNKAILPSIDSKGDVNAFREMLRVLKPSGRLIITFPFGVKAAIIGDGSARSYDQLSIQPFNQLAKPLVQDYYEYQSTEHHSLLNENKRIPNWYTRIKKRIVTAYQKTQTSEKTNIRIKRRHPGPAIWRHIPVNQAAATNQAGHIDGVLCAVWQK